MTLELKHVIKRSGADTHIHPTNLTLGDRGFNILLGTTLSGKTTLIKLMAGLDRPTTGEIWLRGRNVTGVSAQKRNISMVHQQFINYPYASVFENIASPLRVARMPKAEVNQRVERVADLLRLTPMLGRRPGELSGGQQQRTALARALVKDADLVLLDEPLANLDYKLREELRNELPRLFEDRGCTVVYATSEPIEALLLGGHTATLHEGRVTQFGPTGGVYRRPIDLATAQVFSEPPINAIKVTKLNGRFEVGEGISWEANDVHSGLPDGTYTMGIRPHHISPVATASKAVKVEGRILVTELSGSESVIRFEMGGSTFVSQSHGVHLLEIGAMVQFHVETDRALIFDSANLLVGAGTESQA